MDNLHESRLQGIILMPPVIFDVWLLSSVSFVCRRNFVYSC
jgi:hypothetical protein